MNNPIKRIIYQTFCNHTEQKCISDLGQSSYINDIALFGKKDSKIAWRCERCGKILYKKYTDSAKSTINWI